MPQPQIINIQQKLINRSRHTIKTECRKKKLRRLPVGFPHVGRSATLDEATKPYVLTMIMIFFFLSYESPTNSQFACFASATPINQQICMNFAAGEAQLWMKLKENSLDKQHFPVSGAHTHCTQCSEEIYLWNRFNWLGAVITYYVMHATFQLLRISVRVAASISTHALYLGSFSPSSCCRKHSSISSRIVQFMFLMTLITWKTPLEFQKRYTLANKKKKQPSANSINRWENGALKKIRHSDWICFFLPSHCGWIQLFSSKFNCDEAMVNARGNAMERENFFFWLISVDLLLFNRFCQTNLRWNGMIYSKESG